MLRSGIQWFRYARGKASPRMIIACVTPKVIMTIVGMIPILMRLVPIIAVIPIVVMVPGMMMLPALGLLRMVVAPIMGEAWAASYEH
jgi:hypothetical protein